MFLSFTFAYFCLVLRTAFGKKVQKTVAMAKLFEVDGINQTQQQRLASNALEWS